MGAAVKTNKKRRLRSKNTPRDKHSQSESRGKEWKVLTLINFIMKSAIYLYTEKPMENFGVYWGCKKLIKAQKYPQGIHFLAMQLLLWKSVVCEFDPTVALKN